MKKADKYINFINFSITHKIPSILKRMKDTELVDLYEKYSPCFYTKNQEIPMSDLIYGVTTVYSVILELQRRYPKNKQLQNWDFKKEDNHGAIRLLNTIGIG